MLEELGPHCSVPWEGVHEMLDFIDGEERNDPDNVGPSCDLIFGYRPPEIDEVTIELQNNIEKILLDLKPFKQKLLLSEEDLVNRAKFFLDIFPEQLEKNILEETQNLNKSLNDVLLRIWNLESAEKMPKIVSLLPENIISERETFDDQVEELTSSVVKEGSNIDIIPDMSDPYAPPIGARYAFA